MYLLELFERISELVDIEVRSLDKKYDVWYVHDLIRSVGAMSIIPARGDDVRYGALVATTKSR